MADKVVASNTVAELNAAYGADVSGVVQGSQVAQQQFDAIAQKAESSVGRTDGSLKTLRKSLNDTIGVVTSLIGKVFAVVGVMTLFYNAGKAIGDVLFGWSEKEKKLNEAIEANNASIQRSIKLRNEAFASVSNEREVDDYKRKTEELDKMKARLEEVRESLKLMSGSSSLHSVNVGALQSENDQLERRIPALVRNIELMEREAKAEKQRIAERIKAENWGGLSEIGPNRAMFLEERKRIEDEFTEYYIKRATERAEKNKQIDDRFRMEKAEADRRADEMRLMNYQELQKRIAEQQSVVSGFQFGDASMTSSAVLRELRNIRSSISMASGVTTP